MESLDGTDITVAELKEETNVTDREALTEEFVDEDIRGRTRIAEAPVVEGAVVAAIQAATGSSLDEVDQAARGAATMVKVKDG